MNSFLKKITSRKFLAAAAGIIVGVCLVFGPDEDVVKTVAGAISSIVSVVAYIVTEGRIDDNKRAGRQEES